MSILIKDKDLVEISSTPEGLEIIQSKLSQWYSVKVVCRETKQTDLGKIVGKMAPTYSETILSSTYISNGQEIENRYIAFHKYLITTGCETMFIFSNIKEKELEEFIRSELHILVRDLKINKMCQ